MDYTPALYQDTVDLSDISDFEDVMITFSDKDVPALDDMIELWNLQTMVSIKTFTQLLYLIGIYFLIQYLYHYMYL